MDLKALKILCKKTGLKFPSDIKLRDKYWYVTKGASRGGVAALKKYGRVGGDPEYRKKKWYEWWEAVFNILKDVGLNPRLAQSRDVRLDSVKDMQRYFQFIGSHNPKHLQRYLK